MKQDANCFVWYICRNQVSNAFIVVSTNALVVSTKSINTQNNKIT